MKVTVHIDHTAADELATIWDTATSSGFDLKSRGEFMGKHHTEFARDMAPADLQRMLATLGGALAVAA